MDDASAQNLPPGWRSEKLGELGTWSGGGTPTKSVREYWQNGSIPWVSPKDMKSDVVGDAEDRITPQAVQGSATKLVPEGSVLMVVRSGILRHTFPVAICDREVTLNQDMKAITPRGDIDAAYLFYFLRFANDRVLAECSKDGTTVQSIDYDALKSIRVPVPPLPEQRRIARRIDELFAQVAEGEARLKEARAGLEAYRQSVLKAAVTGALTADWRARHRPTETGADLLSRILARRREAWVARGKNPAKYVEPAAPDASILPPLPEGWVWASLDAIADIAGGVTVDKSRSVEGQSSVPYLRVANVQRGAIDLSEVKTIAVDSDTLERLRLVPGDILFNEGGDRDKLGRGWVWEGQLKDCIHQNHVFRARLILGDVVPQLVSHYGNTFGKAYFERHGKQTTNLASISMTMLKSLPVPVCSRAEGLVILDLLKDLLSATDRQGLEVGRQLGWSSALRQSILAAAFSGRLVPQEAPKPAPKRRKAATAA